MTVIPLMILKNLYCDGAKTQPQLVYKQRQARLATSYGISISGITQKIFRE